MKTMKPFPAKDPQDTNDFGLDWSGYLDGDAIITAVWSVPADLVLVRAERAGSLTVAWISGGVAGRDYTVSCRITTDNGRVVERSMELPVRHL